MAMVAMAKLGSVDGEAGGTHGGEVLGAEAGGVEVDGLVAVIDEEPLLHRAETAGGQGIVEIEPRRSDSGHVHEGRGIGFA